MPENKKLQLETGNKMMTHLTLVIDTKTMQQHLKLKASSYYFGSA